MRGAAVGLAAALTFGLAGPAMAESDFDEIQDEEQPGSEIGIEIGRGQVEVGRENGAPIFPIAPFAAAPANRPMFPVAPYAATPYPPLARRNPPSRLHLCTGPVTSSGH